MATVPVKTYIRNGRTVRGYRRRGRAGRGESIVDKVIDYGLGPADKPKPRPKITPVGDPKPLPTKPAAKVDWSVAKVPGVSITDDAGDVTFSFGDNFTSAEKETLKRLVESVAKYKEVTTKSQAQVPMERLTNLKEVKAAVNKRAAEILRARGEAKIVPIGDPKPKSSPGKRKPSSLTKPSGKRPRRGRGKLGGGIAGGRP